MNVRHARSFPLHSIFTHPFGHSRPVYDAPNDGGTANPPPEPPATPPVTPPATPPANPGTPPANPGMSEADAKLLKENMKAKKDLEDAQARLAAFEGLDPAKVKELVAASEAAAKKAKEDEEAAALARGEFDRVKASMVEQHNAALAAAETARKAVETELADARKTIEELTVGADFSGSTYIKNELVLTPSKARLAYGAHFESKDGKTVAYDKPKGAADRTMLVDAQGNALPFDAAIAKLVDADPEKDSLKRSKVVPGSGSKPSVPGAAPSQPQAGAPKGVSRIEAALKARQAAGKTI